MDIRTIYNTIELVGEYLYSKSEKCFMVPCDDNYIAERNWSVQSQTLLKVVRSNLLWTQKDTTQRAAYGS